MPHKLELTEEESGVLEQLLEEEWRNELVELRRTDNAGYKEQIRHHVQLLEAMLRSLRAPQPIG